MPKENTPISAPPDAPVVQVTLDEFCSQLSQTDGRVEMIGAFYSIEKAAGHFKDAAVAFSNRFASFINAPA